MTKQEIEKLNKYDLLFESRLTKTETALTLSTDNLSAAIINLNNDIKEIKKEMKSDFKWTLITFGGAIIALVGLMAKGFHWL